MARGYTPYGYRIENGLAVIDEEQATQVKVLYVSYLSGMSYERAAENAELHISHVSAKLMLQNTHYLGDDFYPAIIDKATFDAAENERVRRAKRLGRIYDQSKEPKQLPMPTHFSLELPRKKFKDPYKQAEYIYSRIESEE